MNKDERAALAERIKEDEALHEKLHKKMLSDSKEHDDALPKPVVDGEADDQANLPLTAAGKKGK